MKNIYIFLLALIPTLGFGQFTYQQTGPSTIVGHLGEDIKFDLEVVNLDASNDQEIKWRISTNTFPSTEWQDYVCDEICYSPGTRFNVFMMSADTTFPITHYISADDVHGTGSSTLCFFDPSDSANTWTCLTQTVFTTPMLLQDTISVTGTNVVVIMGVAYVVDGSNYTEHSDYTILTGASTELIVIDGVIYEYVDGAFVEYTGTVDELTILGTTYTIIDGVAYTVSGNTYTVIGDYVITGADEIAIGSDTFELFEGEYVPLGVETVAIASEFISQNSPNPFTGQTRIKYAYNGAAGVINIHDLTGKLIRSINLQNKEGSIELGSELRAGLYFYSLQSDGVIIDTKRMQVLD